MLLSFRSDIIYWQVTDHREIGNPNVSSRSIQKKMKKVVVCHPVRMRE